MLQVVCFFYTIFQSGRFWFFHISFLKVSYLFIQLTESWRQVRATKQAAFSWWGVSVVRSYPYHFKLFALSSWFCVDWVVIYNFRLRRKVNNTVSDLKHGLSLKEAAQSLCLPSCVTSIHQAEAKFVEQVIIVIFLSQDWLLIQKKSSTEFLYTVFCVIDCSVTLTVC